jgi:hypothetical protein
MKKMIVVVVLAVLGCATLNNTTKPYYLEIRNHRGTSTSFKSNYRRMSCWLNEA